MFSFKEITILIFVLIVSLIIVSTYSNSNQPVSQLNKSGEEQFKNNSSEKTKRELIISETNNQYPIAMNRLYRMIWIKTPKIHKIIPCF